MALSVVQSANARGQFTNGVVTLPGAPTPGNLIIAHAAGFSSTAVATTGWTVLESGTVVSVNYIIAYRYAESGDVAALPNLFTGNGGFWCGVAVEISGVTGVAATDIIGSDDATSTDAAGSRTIATGPVATTGANDLAITSLLCFNGSTPNPSAAGYTDDQSGRGTTPSYAWYLGHRNFSSGDADSTISYEMGGGSVGTSAGLVLLSGGAGPGPDPETPKRRRNVMVLQ